MASAVTMAGDAILAISELPGPASLSFNDGQPVLDLDSFPVGIAIRAIRRHEMIAYATVYGALFVVLCCRFICNSRPTHAHRVGAYVCFIFLTLFRIPMFAMGIVLVDRITRGHGSNWGIACSMDMLSIIGYGWFCAAVYSLCYSWSGRIPCVYCMVQFNDKPHPLKAISVYVIPALSAGLSVAGSVIRLVAVMNAGGPDHSRYSQGTWVCRAGVIAALAFAICLWAVLPYTALRRSRAQRIAREDVDHIAVAAMVSSQHFDHHVRPTATAPAFTVLYLLGFMIVPGGVWRVALVFTSRINYMGATLWTRTPTAFGVLTVAFEVLALVIVCAIDFDGLDSGSIALWNPKACKRRAMANRARQEIEANLSTVYLDNLATPKVSREKHHSNGTPYTNAAFDSTADLIYPSRLSEVGRAA